MSASPDISATKRHLLTIMLEDYFHVNAFSGLIQRGQWYRFETRFEENTLRTLDLLDRFNIKATFFVLGWVADRHPEIVREVAKRGHELGSRGLYQRSTRRMTPAEFRDDLTRARDAVEKVSGTRVHGYRAARRWSSPEHLWTLDVLAEEGYAYDSSVVPVGRAFSSEPWRRFAHLHRHGEKQIWEFPVPTCNMLGWMVPIGGGNYARQFPHTLLKHAVEHWHRTNDAPFVLYTHVWELDPEQPRISGASPLARLRHYRNLDKMQWVLEDYFTKYRFVGVADYLGLDRARNETMPNDARPIPYVVSKVERRRQLSPVTVERRRQVAPVAANAAVGEPAAARSQSPGVPVSLVIPCYNEEQTLPYLANTLRSVEAAMRDRYELQFIFVDDCSSDATFDVLRRVFGAWPNCTFVRHARNLGVAAAILNGIRHAETEIVCSIDCDCTYDPHELQNMIPCLTEGVDVVTASPYHPEGKVRNVPGWRLALSKAASFLYRRTLRQQLFTYTSCFRVYRRDAVVDLRLKETGFLGVAEIIGRLDLRGSTVVEHPATLEVRLFGQSKMKVFRTIIGHLKLLAYLRLARARHKPTARDESLHMRVEAVGPTELNPQSISTVPSE
ncbi:MAG: DUF3473 domain-containing protein [Rubrivivax sp.]|nr:DUF3473 domain-containing protein [Pyrinomonadaceae bacterium]